jgi:glutathionylspermidine synthase
MTAPWLPAVPLSAEVVAAVRHRAIFDYCKWDPQVEDTSTIGDVPILLRESQWREIVVLAERLAREVLAAEHELIHRPELHVTLGLPAAVRRLLTRRRPRSAELARLIRFDFHHTSEGWRISEANTDVPGGLNEASGLARLLSPHYPGSSPVGDPAAAYVEAFVTRDTEVRSVALVHATAYTDDRQVMTYLARQFSRAGWQTHLVSPEHLDWHDGRAEIRSSWTCAPLGAIARFFPAEWLPNLPFSCLAQHFFGGAVTPLSNPASALCTQTKRFPLVWDALTTPLPTWRAMLPETRDPRDAPWRGSDEWILKPALGRVGEDIAIPGVSSGKELSAIEQDVRRHPAGWVAQRRFVSTVMFVEATPLYPCVGVYTVDGRAVGAYGRLAARPLIDKLACDTAVLVVDDSGIESAA